MTTHLTRSVEVEAETSVSLLDEVLRDVLPLRLVLGVDKVGCIRRSASTPVTVRSPRRPAHLADSCRVPLIRAKLLGPLGLFGVRVSRKVPAALLLPRSLEDRKPHTADTKDRDSGILYPRISSAHPSARHP
jgi:hypothetical protein